MWGDTLENVRTKCGPWANGCHRKEHVYGKSRQKPCPPKVREMATVHIAKPGEAPGAVRSGEPLPRPYVTLNDGTVMSFSEWNAKGQPA